MLKFIERYIRSKCDFGFGGRYEWNTGTAVYIPEGHFGTLSIPDMGFRVGIYTGDPTNAQDLQRIVDKLDSCCYIYSPYGDGTILIGDHSGQGFNRIKNLKPGQTVKIITNEYIDKYSVVFVDPNGINNGNIVFSNNTSAYFGGENVLNLYTCNEDCDHITIVHCEKMS